jgi:hypothetical protein
LLQLYQTTAGHCFQPLGTLDQLPETVLPLWAMQAVLGAGANEMVAAVALFIVLDLLLSRLIRPATAR